MSTRFSKRAFTGLSILSLVTISVTSYAADPVLAKNQQVEAGAAVIAGSVGVTLFAQQNKMTLEKGAERGAAIGLIKTIKGTAFAVAAAAAADFACQQASGSTTKSIADRCYYVGLATYFVGQGLTLQNIQDMIVRNGGKPSVFLSILKNAGSYGPAAGLAVMGAVSAYQAGAFVDKSKGCVQASVSLAPGSSLESGIAANVKAGESKVKCGAVNGNASRALALDKPPSKVAGLTNSSSESTERAEYFGSASSAGE